MIKHIVSLRQSEFEPAVAPWAIKKEVVVRDSEVCYVLWFTMFTFNKSFSCSVTQFTLV